MTSKRIHFNPPPSFRQFIVASGLSIAPLHNGTPVEALRKQKVSVVCRFSVALEALTPLKSLKALRNMPETSSEPYNPAFRHRKTLLHPYNPIFGRRKARLYPYNGTFARRKTPSYPYNPTFRRPNPSSYPYNGIFGVSKPLFSRIFSI